METDREARKQRLWSDGKLTRWLWLRSRRAPWRISLIDGERKLFVWPEIEAETYRAIRFVWTSVREFQLPTFSSHTIASPPRGRAELL